MPTNNNRRNSVVVQSMMVSSQILRLTALLFATPPTATTTTTLLFSSGVTMASAWTTRPRVLSSASRTAASLVSPRFLSSRPSVQPLWDRQRRRHSSTTTTTTPGYLLSLSPLEDFDDDDSVVDLASSRMGRPTSTVASSDDSWSDDDDHQVGEVAPLQLEEKTNGSSSSLTAAATTSSSSSSSSSSQQQQHVSSVLSQVGLDPSEFPYLQGLPPSRRVHPATDIFCNRELKLGGIQAIGFDMDYTLAQYRQPAFDQLAFDGAKQKLVERLGYPEEVLDFTYDHSFWARGLIIDIQRGNFLKIDRHKYVRVAYHGFERMSPTTRKHLYSRTFNKVMSFSEKHFINMDTLFQFVDAHLFACLIDLKDHGEHDVLDFKTYEEIYKEMRECVDLCHRDGSMKGEIARNPDPYIVEDPGLVPMLKRYREQGVQLFLLTNSDWSYTQTVMNYLYHGRKVDEERQRDNDWLELFDLVVVLSCKPAYMIDPYLNLFRVDPRDGSLRNTDGIYEIQALGPNGAAKFLKQGKTFQGGNWMHLQAMLETTAGEEILYVGDHLYSDVLRSKRTLGWRSAFIVPELEHELNTYRANLPLWRKIQTLRSWRDHLGAHAETVRLDMEASTVPETRQTLQDELTALQQENGKLKATLRALSMHWHTQFHPVWGALFNAGYQDSRFAFYVQNYACVYTCKASNLGLVSADRTFRASFEGLPHDKLMEEDEEQQQALAWESMAPPLDDDDDDDHE